MVWLARRFDYRVRQEGILKALAADLTGRRIAVALGLVDEVRAFVNESPAA